MEKTFNPSQIEQAMYNAWESKGYFKPSGDNSNGAYCIMIPAAKRHRQPAYGTRFPANHHGRADPLQTHVG